MERIMIEFKNLLAGKATFTVSNDKKEHYTFKVTRSKDKRVYFVALLTGADNEHSYQYIGLLMPTHKKMRVTSASKMSDDSIPVKVFNWAMKIIDNVKALPEGYDILPAGKCFKCGRKLTQPESIKSGLGPHCRKMLA